MLQKRYNNNPSWHHHLLSSELPYTENKMHLSRIMNDNSSSHQQQHPPQRRPSRQTHHLSNTGTQQEESGSNRRLPESSSLLSSSSTTIVHGVTTTCPLSIPGSSSTTEREDSSHVSKTDTGILAAHACDSCRQRKAKSSRTKQACTQRHGLKLKCTYSGGKRERERLSVVLYLVNLESPQVPTWVPVNN